MLSLQRDNPIDDARRRKKVFIVGVREVEKIFSRGMLRIRELKKL